MTDSTNTLQHEAAAARGSPVEVFGVFLKLGLTSFGGPIAHLGYFREEFVARRQWLDDHTYADLVALCQFLPGPASSQVGISIGLFRAGYLGAFAAWLGFTLPSALALVLFAGIRERLDGADVPIAFKGTAIAMITAGFMSLAFMGFAGLDRFH